MSVAYVLLCCTSTVHTNSFVLFRIVVVMLVDKSCYLFACIFRKSSLTLRQMYMVLDLLDVLYVKQRTTQQQAGMEKNQYLLWFPSASVLGLQQWLSTSGDIKINSVEVCYYHAKRISLFRCHFAVVHMTMTKDIIGLYGNHRSAVNFPLQGPVIWSFNWVLTFFLHIWSIPLYFRQWNHVNGQRICCV